MIKKPDGSVHVVASMGKIKLPCEKQEKEEEKEGDK